MYLCCSKRIHFLIHYVSVIVAGTLAGTMTVARASHLLMTTEWSSWSVQANEIRLLTQCSCIASCTSF